MDTARVDKRRPSQREKRQRNGRREKLPPTTPPKLGPNIARVIHDRSQPPGSCTYRKESESHHAEQHPPTVRKQGDKNVASPCFHHANVATQPGSELIKRSLSFNYYEP